VKLRYQLRGLGIGIIVTALLMGVATKDGIPLTDAEIKARALALGMVESDSLKLTDIGKVTPEPVGSPTEAPTPEPDGNPAKSPTPEPVGSPTESPTQNPDGAPARSPAPSPGAMTHPSGDGPTATPAAGRESSSPQPSVSEDEGEVVEIVIELGENSSEICKKLEDAGLVSDAAAFDRYLCNSGYSRRIRDGVYKIPVGSSEEEIVEMIVKNNLN